MADALFGWKNAVVSGTLAAGSEAAGLGAAQLAVPQGSSATAWQTASGVQTPAAGAWFSIDAGASATWRAFLLARTNLSAAATIRWRVGVVAVADAVVLSVDSNAGASKSVNTTRVGTATAPDGSAAVTYTNAAGSAYVGGTRSVIAGIPYKLTLKAYRVSGSGTAGNILAVDAPGLSRISRSMSLLPAAGSGVSTFTIDFTPASSGTASYYFFADTGVAGGTVGLVSAALDVGLTYDSGTVTPGVRPGYAQAVHIAPADVVGQYARCDISDGNTDGFVSVGLAYAGPVWQPSFNIGWGSSHGIDPQVDEVTTRGGQEYPILRWKRRRWDIAIDTLAAAEVWPSLLEWIRTTTQGDNVLFIADPASADLQAEAIFGRAGSLADISYPIESTDYRAWRGRVTERL